MSKHSGPKVILYLPLKVLTTSHHKVQDSLKRVQPSSHRQVSYWRIQLLQVEPGVSLVFWLHLYPCLILEGKTTTLLLLLATCLTTINAPTPLPPLQSLPILPPLLLSFNCYTSQHQCLLSAIDSSCSDEETKWTPLGPEPCLRMYQLHSIF